MNRPRASIRQVLAVVALVGADLAIYRFLTDSDDYNWNMYRLRVLAPTCLAPNIAAFVALSVRGRSRACCVGFLLFGVAAAYSLLLALNDPPSESATFSGDGGVEIRSYPGGAMARMWLLYVDFARDGLHRLGFDYNRAGTGLKSTVFNAMVRLLPQLLVACIGGWAAWQVAGRRGAIEPSNEAMQRTRLPAGR